MFVNALLVLYIVILVLIDWKYIISQSIYVYITKSLPQSFETACKDSVANDMSHFRLTL